MPGFVLFFAFIPIIVVMSIVMSLDKKDESMKETHVFNPGDIGFVNTPEGLDECRVEGIWPDCDPDHIMYQVQSLISSDHMVRMQRRFLRYEKMRSRLGNRG